MQRNRRVPRLAAALLAALAASLLVASLAAAAATTRITVNASVKPQKAGTPAHPVGVTATVMIDLAPLGTAQPPVTDEVDIFLPKALRSRGAKFPSFSAQMIAGPTGVSACPAGSKVGTGVAAGTALGLTEQLNVAAFNGPGGSSLLLFLSSGVGAPLTISEPLIGSYVSPSNVPNPGDFSSELTFPVPQNILHPIPGANVSITHISVQIGASRKVGRKKVGYFESVGPISALAVTLLTE
jgi:hypothetical protein